MSTLNSTSFNKPLKNEKRRRRANRVTADRCRQAKEKRTRCESNRARATKSTRTTRRVSSRSRRLARRALRHRAAAQAPRRALGPHLGRTRAKSPHPATKTMMTTMRRLVIARASKTTDTTRLATVPPSRSHLRGPIKRLIRLAKPSKDNPRTRKAPRLRKPTSRGRKRNR